MQGNSSTVGNCEITKCDACGFGKGNCQSNKLNTTNNNTMNEKDIKKDHILTGNMVSGDHYILWYPGRL